MLLPDPREGLTDSDLDAAYAWPGWPQPHPWVRANMVATVDGAARAPDGVSHGISSDADRRVFGRLRGLADVVLAGAGTVRQEGYRPARPKPDFADRRAAAGQAPVPAIAVLTRTLSVDLSAPLFTEAAERTILLTCDASDADARRRAAEVAEVVVVGDADVDLAAALDALHDRGLARVHCEGGPTLLAQLVAADLLDELLLTVSPLLAGGTYADRAPLHRILSGAELPGAPRPLTLHHVLEDDGSLFLSYRRD
jgi:riboflavin biosynthesis pyrimidine reductase